MRHRMWPEAPFVVPCSLGSTSGSASRPGSARPVLDARDIEDLDSPGFVDQTGACCGCKLAQGGRRKRVPVLIRLGFPETEVVTTRIHWQALCHSPVNKK